MFNKMKIYTVHIKPEEGINQKPIFVKEGFNIFAFIFNIFWTLYHRLWIPTLLIIAVNLLLMFLHSLHLLNLPSVGAIHLVIHVIVGLHGNDWVRSRLAKTGYILADISAADSLLRAEQRYFERALA